MTPLVAALNLTRDVTLGRHIRVANTMWRRMVGLLRDSGLGEGHGLWIVPCNSIHSFAMRFDFDAVFLNKQLEVVHLKSEMKPWGASPVILKAHSVLELPAGVIAQSGTTLGDRFEMQPVTSTP